MSKQNRESVLKKIKALLAKTTENGCTEEEALSALSMAKAMMDAYEVTQEDVEDAKREEAEVHSMEAHDPNSIRTGLCQAVARFTNTRTWRSNAKRYWTKVSFCGLAADVDLADWLLESLSGFVTRELVRHLFRNNTSDRNKRRLIVSGFVFGCLRRINERLNALADQSEDGRTAMGNALVVVKDALIEAKLKDAGILLHSTKGRSRNINRDAFNAGLAAGDRASFNRPVGADGRATILLGRG